MAQPKFRIYLDNAYIGTVKDPLSAAILAEGWGNGTEVRIGHRKMDTVFTEDSDREVSAATSLEAATNRILENTRRMLNGQHL